MIRLRALLSHAVTGAAIVAIAASANAQNAPVTVNVNATLNRHPINPNIYGVAYGDQNTLADLNVQLNRLGGNNLSRYNWKINADNRANDWFFESIADASAVPGERGDTFISMGKSANAQSMVTIPMMDWVAKLGTNRSKLGSFSVKKYGAQKASEGDFGNGVKTNGTYVTGNNPNDANTASTPAFQQDWVRALVGKWGTAANGGLKYYILDNEPGIWHATHRDIHPTGCTLDELKNRTIAYAAAIKAVDPTALVVGPEEWGWTNYLYSGYDSQYGAAHGWGTLPDRAAHGNMDAMPWLLNQLRQYEATNGQRLLDVFTLHYYPQSGEFNGATDTNMQLMRNRSTRSLWDPTYVDQSWIGAVVQLIPRMRSWANTYYPGTPIGITEYNWGAETHINGATAQADIWGIFGRENLDLAARWTTPNPITPTYKVMKLYRNYDGNKSGFGDVSVSATVPNPDNLSAFASTRTSDGALTVVVVNKVLSGNTPVTVNVSGFNGNGIAHAWQVTAANAIVSIADSATVNGNIVVTVPPQSVTLFVLPPSGTQNNPPNAPANLAAVAGNGQVRLTWDASNGAATYTLKRSTTHGGPYTSVASGITSTNYIDLSVTNETTYYYVVSATSVIGESADSNEAVATPSASIVNAVRINSGGPAYNATIGAFLADTYSTTGSTVDRGAISISGTSDPVLYRTLRYGTTFGYSIPVANGSYTLKLHFAETGGAASGARTFNVGVNGVAWLSNLDVYAQAGGASKALIKSQTVSVTNGVLNLNFVVTKGTNAFVNAIEVVSQGGQATAPPAPTNLTATAGNGQVALSWSASAGAASYAVKRSTTSGGPYTTVSSGITSTGYTNTGLTNGTTYYFVVTASNSVGESGNSNQVSATPNASQGSAVRINSGGPAYSGTAGAFVADAYFTGGAAIDRGAISISNTSDPTLYRTQRYATGFGYSIPVANGNYTLNLHFAESGGYTTNQRKFNVSVNGTAWLSSFDVFVQAGGANKALIKSIPVSVTNGKVDINFATANGINAFINAIELVPAP